MLFEYKKFYPLNNLNKNLGFLLNVNTTVSFHTFTSDRLFCEESIYEIYGVCTAY